MTEISDKEIEAARAVLEQYVYDDGGCEVERVPAMVREMLEAAARVRAEGNAEGGEPEGELCKCAPAFHEHDEAGAKHCRSCDAEWHPAPQPSGPVKVKPLKWDEHPAGGQQAIAAGLGLYRVHANGDDWYLVPDHMGKGGRAAAQADYERRILSALTAVKPEQHPDDEAIDRFAAAMKAKMKWEREERGRYGWNDPEVCSEEYLAKLLIEHLAKGNDGNFEDVANFCMMLHQRGAHPRVLTDALMEGNPEQSGWQPIETAPKDGTKVDLWVVNLLGEGKRIPDCSWGWGQWIGSKGLAAERLGHKATHWMPLPTPPTAGGGDE